VLTHDRLDELVPIEPAAMPDRQVIEWDKDDIDALKFMKVDCLALGMLTCMKRAFNFLAEAKGIKLDLATIPSEDPRTYAMIRKADTLGTFQIESRAQMAMLPRMKPRTFYDLVIEVAIVRPGPIQGDMVHPYLRRREGKEPVVYPKESHAASFALIAYASSWMKCWHPDVFCASLLNAQPMGFYAPAQIVRDARDHGVKVRPVCINTSRWDCTLEPLDEDKFAVRLGFRQVRGLSNKDGAEIVASRADTPFKSVDDLWRRADVPVASLAQLAEADAMKESLGLARREALWALKALRDEPLELFAAAAAREARTIEEVREPAVSLRPMTSGGEVVEDYRHVGLTLRQHPASFLRADLASRRIVIPVSRPWAHAAANG
jgi:DNA polymerase III alpha subunit